MNKQNGVTRGKHVLVTITPYIEQERRTTNGTSTNGPPPPPLPLSSSAKPKQGEDAVEMQSIESFKLKESPSHVVPKPPSTYFPLTSVTTTSASSTTSSVVGKGPLVSGNNHVATSAIKSQGNDNKDTSPGELTLDTKKTSGVLSAANKQNVKPAGKVAIRIGAYEGETKQPSRLEFLPQAARSSEKGNDEELANGPVVSRLQNELAATLQRSNLKKKTDGDNATIKSASEIIAPISSISEDPNRAMTLMHSDIEKLASALSNNKVTIKVNPEIGGR